jgi:hypothetical protein
MDTLLQQRGPHNGRYCYGKTPIQTFIQSLPLEKQKLLGELQPAA